MKVQPHPTLDRLQWAVVVGRSYDYLNPGFGQHNAVQSGLAPGIWSDTFKIFRARCQ